MQLACPILAFGIEPGHGGAVTLTLPRARPLSGHQRRAVERARDFLRAAAAGPRTLVAHLDVGAVQDTALFYATDGFGAAQKLLLDLLAILDELAPRSLPVARRRDVMLRAGGNKAGGRPGFTGEFAEFPTKVI